MRLHPHTIQDKHKFPRSGPDFRKVSIGKWNAHREGAVDAKSNRFGQPRANVMQKTDLTRQPLLALHVISESTIAFSLEFLTLSCANAHPNDHGEDSQGIGNPSIGKSENPTLNFCAAASFPTSERSESAEREREPIV